MVLSAVEEDGPGDLEDQAAGRGSPPLAPEAGAGSVGQEVVGAGAGGGDGDGDGGDETQWTVEMCSKRLSMLHRKLRQVKELCFRQTKDPDSLDAAQLVKIGRKDDLQAQIAELEALRRKLDRAQKAKDSGENVATTGRRQEHAAGAVAQESETEAVRYTPDGYRLASPRKASKTPARGVWSSQVERTSPAGEAESEDNPPAGFRWGEGFEDMQKATEVGDAGMEDLAGGYPKRLASVMSFCRISTKATCEVLIGLGRVTVNGQVVTNPSAKVDVLADNIVCDGEAVTIPPKIDNSDMTRQPRDDIGKRTGPVPKAEKNTWKNAVRYRWNVDDGLLASRKRTAASFKAKKKQRSWRGI